jgi:acyl-CoA synthetase
MTAPLLRRDPDALARCRDEPWYLRRSLASRIQELALQRPSALAYCGTRSSMTWQQYHERSETLADVFVSLGLDPGDRVGVVLPDGPEVHAVYVAAEKAGLVVMGIGPRAGEREVRHLVQRASCRAIVSSALIGDRPADQLVRDLRNGGARIEHHLVIDDECLLDPRGTLHRAVLDGQPVDLDGLTTSASADDRVLGPDDLFLLNSTSGTTGLPKCVMQHQNRWAYFHHVAAAAGDLQQDDVVMSLVAAPFGFGLWTSHFTPTLLGATCVVMERFSPTRALEMIESAAVTVLACVSTQFVMMLNAPVIDTVDLATLRVMFTGGEAVPRDRAAAFEQRTGAAVLQFFGSNETGALSRTSLRDSEERRLTTAGRVIDEMHVRLLAEDGSDVTATGGPGQPACRGPATCLGYYDDEVANEQLFTADGWMLTGDIATIDAEGYLRVVGRASDLIIRGGKNISAVEVESEVGTHPSVAMVAAVAAPDPTFGERVCAFVVLRDGISLDLDGLRAHLHDRGTSKDLIPELLVVVDALPQASGGKVAKGELRSRLVNG